MTTLKGLQEKWDSIEKKNAKGNHAKGNQYSFYEWFLHEKSETIKSTVLFLQLIKRTVLPSTQPYTM